VADEPENVPEEGLTEEQVLSEGIAILEESPQARVIVPSRGGIFEEDGTCKVAIIRPCVSRGKRLRGLPPIYTPGMLAENANVFTGWLMYMDHLTEAIVQLLQERGRSIRELGGRITRAWFDPELTFPDDEQYGYQKGGVVGRALPQPPIRAMLEADPEILHTSINAYPRAIRPGTAPWNSALRGMLVEGIRAKPPGSVDWVPRGGAGGRVLQEWEDATVSILEGYYDAAAERENMSGLNLKTATADQLRSKLLEDNPDLAKELGLKEEAAPPAPDPTPKLQEQAPAGITQEELDRQLAAQRETLLRESEATVDDLVEERLQEREESRELEKVAHGLIKRSGLPQGYQADLLRRWSVYPSGPSAALAGIEPVMEGDGKVKTSAADVLKEKVGNDIKHAADLIAEATGTAPRVTGLGGSGSGSSPHEGRRRSSSFREFLVDSGDLKETDQEKQDEELRKMLREGLED
jgi:hypothetical protein